jgi:hypothetical protein
MAWQGNGMGAAWSRHAMCESAFSGTAWQGNGMGAAWSRHAMCESALSLHQYSCDNVGIIFAFFLSVFKLLQPARSISHFSLTAQINNFC